MNFSISHVVTIVIFSWPNMLKYSELAWLRISQKHDTSSYSWVVSEILPTHTTWCQLAVDYHFIWSKTWKCDQEEWYGIYSDGVVPATSSLGLIPWDISLLGRPRLDNPCMVSVVVTNVSLVQCSTNFAMDR